MCQAAGADAPRWVDTVTDGGASVASLGHTLQDWGIDRRIVCGTNRRPLCFSPAGKPWTVSGLGAAFRRIRTRAGLAKDLVVYLTRHEHGTRVCELHGIQAAADALGHTDVKTTSVRYVKKNRRLERDRQEGLFDDDRVA